MFSFLKSVFVPTRFDACCVVIVLHWMTVLITLTALPLAIPLSASAWLEPISAAATLTWVAIAASWCWRGIDKSRAKLLICSSLAALVFVNVWYWLNPEITAVIEPTRTLKAENSTEPFSEFWSATWPIFRNMLVAIAVWPMSLLFRYVARFLMRPFQALSKRYQTDRTGTLFATAAILFVLAVASRISSSIDFQVGFGSNIANNIVGGLLAAVCAWTIALFWFPRSYSTSGRLVQKIVSVLFVLGAFVVPFFDMPSQANSSTIVSAFSISLGGLTFIFSVIGINGSAQTIREVADETPKRTASFRPSLVSLVATLFLAGAIVTPVAVFGQPSTMIFTNRRATLAETFELAVESAKGNWDSGGRVSYAVSREYSQPVWKVEFKGSDRNDLLECLPKRGVGAVQLNDMTPDFDVSCIRGKVGMVLLNNCKVSTSQLNYLLNSVGLWGISGSFEIIDDGTPVSPGVISSISFTRTDHGVAKKFFDVCKCESQMTWMFFNTEVNNVDWPTIEEVAQKCRVYLQSGWAADFTLPTKTKPLGRVHVYDGYGGSTSAAFQKRLFLETDMWLNLPALNSIESGEVAWKVWMLRGTMGYKSFETLFQNSRKPIDEFATELGMAYEQNGDEITSLYFPYGVPVREIVQLKELRVLSFDPSWASPALGGISPTLGTPENIIHLGSLTSLEELYFGPTFIPNTLAVMQKLPSLKHLQIPAVVRKVTGQIGFDACQSLESITFYGVPDDQTYREISQLKKLSKLTIVDITFDEVLTPEYVEKLKAKFPLTKVTVLKPDEASTLIPKSFRDYRDNFRKELRADTDWLDELLDK